MSLIENIKTEFESENIEKGEAIIESPPFSLPSKASIAKVGDLIRHELDSEVSLDEELLNEALTKLVIYRYYHSYNISIFRNLLNRKIKRLNLSNQCIISSRVKRAQSIFLKLIRYPTMKLSRMGDLAGVRVIFPDMKTLKLFIDDYNCTECEIKKEYFDSHNSRINDYIKYPKEDGYRSIHQIFEDTKYKLKLELQIRTQLQHEWATVVEILGSLMKTSFKTGEGAPKEKFFLKLCSALFSYQENCPVLDELRNYSMDEICLFLKELNNELGIIEKLKSVNSIKLDENPEAAYYLLKLDLENHKTDIYTFNKDEKYKAIAAYSGLERDTKNCHVDVVLVSVDDVKNLKQAYPNYFLDTTSFIKRIESIL